MEEELLFRIVFILLFATFAGVRIYYRSKTIGRESKKDYQKTDWSLLLLFIAIIGYFAGLFFYVLLPDWIAWAWVNLTSPIRWIGVFSAILAILLVFWTHRVLGEQYSARQEIQINHRLIDQGPYSRVRHPMYTGFNLFSFSVGVISSNLLLILFAVLIVIPFPWLARREEEMLLDELGEEYGHYMRRTGRFFPSFRKRE